MRVIIRLTLRYLMLNKKRTLATIAGITGAMLAVTMCLIFSEGMLAMLRDSVAASEGSYHAIFHNLTESQFEHLDQNDQIARCVVSDHCGSTKPGRVCAEIELKRVSLTMFGRTQKAALDLGMEPLPEESRVMLPDRRKAKYDVTYHMELLEYYGISEPDSAGAGMIMNVILAALILVSGILIYNSFAISLFEKKKYLGTLGSIGATPRQKSLCVYTEGLLCGLAGIPIGTAAGVLSMAVLARVMSAVFSVEIPFYGIRMMTLIKLGLLGIIIILIACSIPASDAKTYSSIDMIMRQVGLGKDEMRITNLLSCSGLHGIWGRIALKNIFVSGRKYLINGVLLASAFCVLLDGMAFMRGMKGDYYPADKQIRPAPDRWIELYTQNTDKIDALCSGLSQLEGIRSISAERRLDLEGVIIPDEEIDSGLNDYRIQSWAGLTDSRRSVKDAATGKTVSGRWTPMSIIGLDSATFRRYAAEAGAAYDAAGDGANSVIIEDCVAISTGRSMGRRAILDGNKLRRGDYFSFTYSRYGDMNEYSMFSADGDLPTMELLDGKLRVLAVTGKAPPVPYISSMHDEIDGYRECTDGELRVYLPLNDFNQLIAGRSWLDTYSSADVTGESKTIQTLLKFEEPKADEKSLTDSIRKIAGEEGLSAGPPHDIDKNKGLWLPANETYYYGNYTSWKKDYWLHSETSLLIVLGYGIVLLISALSLSNIFQNISTSVRVRKREFAMYLSMGMTGGQLRRMLAAETSAYGIFGCLMGIPVSLISLAGVYQDYNGYIIDWQLPWDLVIAEMALAVMVILIPLIHTFFQLRALNVIETIRNENY